MTNIQSNNLELELASGFILLSSQPRRYNIVFVDTQLADELRPIAEEAQTEWNRVYSDSQELASVPLNQERLEELYKEIFQSAVYTDAYSNFDRLCYWQSGTYRLEMRIKTNQPESNITKDWQFELTDQNVKILRLNSILIFQQICGQKVQYYSAFAKYQKTEA